MDVSGHPVRSGLYIIFMLFDLSESDRIIHEGTHDEMVDIVEAFLIKRNCRVFSRSSDFRWKRMTFIHAIMKTFIFLTPMFHPHEQFTGSLSNSVFTKDSTAGIVVKNLLLLDLLLDAIGHLFFGTERTTGDSPLKDVMSGCQFSLDIIGSRFITIIESIQSQISCLHKGHWETGTALSVDLSQESLLYAFLELQYFNTIMIKTCFNHASDVSVFVNPALCPSIQLESENDIFTVNAQVTAQLSQFQIECRRKTGIFFPVDNVVMNVF